MQRGTGNWAFRFSSEDGHIYALATWRRAEGIMQFCHNASPPLFLFRKGVNWISHFLSCSGLSWKAAYWLPPTWPTLLVDPWGRGRIWSSLIRNRKNGESTPFLPLLRDWEVLLFGNTLNNCWIETALPRLKTMQLKQLSIQDYSTIEDKTTKHNSNALNLQHSLIWTVIVKQSYWWDLFQDLK